jgi:hypothetical protein
MGNPRNPKSTGRIRIGEEVYLMQPQKLIDYHLHTAVTIDGKMTEAEACERALFLGIQEIAFTNHVMPARDILRESPFLYYFKSLSYIEALATYSFAGP